MPPTKEIPQSLLNEVLKTLQERSNAVDEAREAEAKAAEREGRIDELEKIVKAIQDSQNSPSRAKLAALGRYTNPGTWTPGRKEYWDSQEQKEAFVEFTMHVIKQDTKGLNDWYKTNAKAALNENTSSQGAYLVPDDFVPVIWRTTAQSSVLLRKARGMPMKTDYFTMPAKATGWTTYWGDEGAAYTQGEPTFGNITWTADKLTGYGLMSDEWLEDAAPDVASFLLEQATEGCGTAIDLAGFFSTGASNGPSGVTGIAYLASKVSTQASTTALAPTYEEIISLPELFSQNSHLEGAEFYMSNVVLQKLRKITTSDGFPLWTQMAQTADGLTLLGYPVNLVEVFPSTYADATPYILFGNMRHYIYGDRRKFSMQRSVDFKFNTDQQALKFNMRIAFPNLANAAGVKACFAVLTTTGT